MWATAVAAAKGLSVEGGVAMSSATLAGDRGGRGLLDPGRGHAPAGGRDALGVVVAVDLHAPAAAQADPMRTAVRIGLAVSGPPTVGPGDDHPHVPGRAPHRDPLDLEGDLAEQPLLAFDPAPE